jgi:hypothetical protein
MRVETLRTIVKPILEQEGKAYVSIGCERVYAAILPPTQCKRCGGVHDIHEIEKLEDLDNIPLDHQ